MAETPDHERMWLQPRCCADPYGGRQWCQDDVFSDQCEEGNKPTEYVRADLASSPTAADLDQSEQARRLAWADKHLADRDKDAEIARLREATTDVAGRMEAMRHGTDDWFDLTELGFTLRAALTQGKAMTKKPWGDDYVPDDRPWTFPPNALLPTEEVTPEMIEAGAQAVDDTWLDDSADRARFIYETMRALAKPDELKD